MTKTYEDVDWSTSRFPDAARVDAWNDILSQNIFPMQIAAHQDQQFMASWKRFDLGKIDFHRLASRPQSVRHEARSFGRGSAVDYLFIYFRSHPAVVSVEGHSFTAPEGSLVLLDNDRPFQLEFPKGSVCLSLQMDDRWLRNWLPYPDLVTDRCIDGGRPWVQPLLSFLRALEDQGPDAAAFGRETLAEQLGALMAHGCGIRPNDKDTHNSLALNARAQAVLRSRYAEKGLTVADCARDIGISERYLHRLFAQNGTTFGTALMELRLEQARSMLSLARYAPMSVASIAWDCGFQDCSHFTRRYRSRFGETPGQTRAKAQM